MRPVDLEELSPGEQVVAGTGIVLVVDLLFLPWHSIDLGLTTSTRSAVESPNALLGVGALLLTAAVVAVTLLRALRPERTLPELPLPWERAAILAAVAVLALLVSKLAMDTDSLGVGAWLGVLLAAGVAVGAQLATRDGSAVSRRAPRRRGRGGQTG